MMGKGRVGMKRICCALLLMVVQIWGVEPLAVYLTWEGDPSTTMVIQWLIEEGVPETTVHYGVVGESEMQRVVGQSFSLRNGVAYLQRVELRELLPDRDYFFFIGESR